jgi:hypothetical protein
MSALQRALLGLMGDRALERFLLLLHPDTSRLQGVISSCKLVPMRVSNGGCNRRNPHHAVPEDPALDHARPRPQWTTAYRADSAAMPSIVAFTALAHAVVASNQSISQLRPHLC